MSADTILDQTALGSAAAAAFVPKAVEMVTAPAGRPMLANLLAYLRERSGTTRDRANEISTSEFSSHGL
ncbi:MAG: hypothetical protein ACREFO_14275 [Acetobacteraceae bacterium]